MKLLTVELLAFRHYINRTAHKDFDPLRRTDSILSAAFYDQMVVLVSSPQPFAPPCACSWARLAKRCSMCLLLVVGSVRLA
jgi:peroxiredoxin